MPKIHIFLDARRPVKTQISDKPSYPLKFSISVKGRNQFMFNTGISVPKENWVNDTIKGLPKKDVYNNILRMKAGRIETDLLNLELSGEILQMSQKEIKDRLLVVFKNDPQSSSTARPNLLIKKYFHDFAQKKDKERTKGIYLQTLVKLDKYCDSSKLLFTDITPSWLRDFEQKMRAEGLATNTISMHLRNLRAVFNDAIDNEVINQGVYPFRRFKIKTERTIKRSLSVDQLRRLRDYECSEHQRKYRDVFMLIFYLMGINIIDLLHIEGVRDGRIEYRRAKTGRLYSVLVPPEAMEIIERYQGKEYMLDAMDNYGNYKDFAKRLNNNLQQIGPFEMVSNNAKNESNVKKNKKQITPLFPDITSYWARHTWATIAASLDIPKETIAAALGHGGNTVTDIYIDFDQRKVDAANRKVIDYLNGYTSWLD